MNGERFGYIGPLFRDHRPARAVADTTLSAQLEALARSREDAARRDIWRHSVGLGGNAHGQLDYEPEDSL